MGVEVDYPKIRTCFNTSEHDIVQELYKPSFSWATRFDRGVGFFTSGWLSRNIEGLSDFAFRGGKMRIITSPILSDEDSYSIIAANESNGTGYKKLETVLSQNIEALQAEMEKDILNTFSWLLYDGIIELKFAIPCNRLINGFTINSGFFITERMLCLFRVR